MDMITDRLIKQGFRYSKLCKTFKKFSRKHRTIFNRYGVSVRQHIDEGICRPLCIIRKLSKNITMNRCRHNYVDVTVVYITCNIWSL